MAAINARVRRVRREGKGMTAIVMASLRGAAHYAADAVIKDVKTLTRNRIRSVGLGNLANVVDVTSSLKLRRTNSDNAFGAIYARRRRGVTNRGEQALIAYSEGADIVPTAGKQWLAFPTKNIPQRAGRTKITPDLYRKSGLTSSIGKLVFIQRSATEAWLIVRKVQVSKRTGVAKARGKRQSRAADPKAFIIAFILIRYTNRMKRYDQGELIQRGMGRFRDYAGRYQAGLT